MKPSEIAKRNKQATVFLVHLLLCCYGILAQARAQQAGEIRGQVLEDSIGVSSVHILNLSANRATISDDQGYFEISAGIGDTLLVSAIRYERQSFSASRQMLETGLLKIYLTPFVNQLEEVVLWPYNLSGDLGRDLTNIPKEETVSATSLGLPNALVPVKTKSERMLFEATSGTGLIPLNPILNGISGRTRMLKRRLARNRAYQQTVAVRARYSDSLFVNVLGIPAIRIPDFMYFCEVDPRFGALAGNEDRLRMWGFLREKSGKYRKNNHLE